MNKISKKTYKRLTRILINVDKDYSLRLSTGNCGVYAIALQKYLGFGELVEMDDHAHVLLKIEDIYLDGKGIWSELDLYIHTKWEEHMKVYGLKLTTKERILTRTAIWRRPITIDEMESIIKTNVKKPITI